MKKLTIALAAILGLAFVAPIPGAQAQETKKIIIKRGHDRDRGHHFGMREHHKKVVIIKRHRRHHEM
jgi:hypothetical protein